MQDQFEHDKQEWISSHEKQSEEERKFFEKKTREEQIRERNKEIEAIINKLGDETHIT